MKKIVILSFIVFSFLFIGCADKQVVYKTKLVCTEQLLIPRVHADIRIHPNDVEVAKAFSESIDSAYGFYEGQVEVNNKLCKGVDDE